MLLAGPDGTAPRGAFLAGMHDAVVLTSFTGRQQGVQVDLTPAPASPRAATLTPESVS